MGVEQMRQERGNSGFLRDLVSVSGKWGLLHVQEGIVSWLRGLSEGPGGSSLKAVQEIGGDWAGLDDLDNPESCSEMEH